MEPEVLDVAIIGAGVSGVYTGWRLMTGKYQDDGKARALGTAERPRNIQLFELSDRVGGRVYSYEMPGLESRPAELGGWAFKRSYGIVWGLVGGPLQLEWNVSKFSFGDPSTNWLFFRGMGFTEEMLVKDSSSVPYRLAPFERGKSPVELFAWIARHIVTQAAEEFPGRDRRKWDELKQTLRYRFYGPFYNELLMNLGFWNVIEQLTSNECYEFLQNVGGMSSNTMNWNAAEALPYTVFENFTPDYYYIRGGYQQIPARLAERFQRAGGVIHQRHRLCRFDKLEQGSPARYQLLFKDGTGQTVLVLANHIILAMPPRSLELLDQNTFFFANDKLRAALHSVYRQPAFKLFLGFRSPWWKDLMGIPESWSFTDLPIRIWAFRGDQSLIEPLNTNALMMASFNDMGSVPFWQPLQEQAEPRNTYAAQLCSWEHQTPIPQDTLVPKLMVGVALKQVAQAQGIALNDIPPPYIAAYRNWGGDPYGAGYHAWKVGINSKEVMPFMRKPLSDEAVHVVGEAFSGIQGTVEGALCVSEKMLQEQFGLKWPEWLPSDYYLGY
jgi:hypothetical protein